MADDAELAEALARLLAGRLGDGVRIEHLARLSSGASRRSYTLDAVSADGSDVLPLVLQQGSAAAGAEPALPMPAEAALVQAAARAGVPVPEVVAAGGADSPLGVPFVLTGRLGGEALPTRLFRDPRYAPGVALLTDQAAAALAAVHAISPGEVELVPHDLVAYYRQVLDVLGERRPALELAYRWLDGHRPPARPEAVVHGDFRLGNLLVDETGLRAVLDWELAHLGDPLEDLAWPAIRAWRFDKVRPPGAFCERASWIAAYEAASGVPVERSALAWWEVAGTFKWAVICLMQAWRHLSGLTRSVELAAIGRRVAECEWDLLGLLQAAGAFAPGQWAPLEAPGGEPAEGTDGGELHGSSTAAVLVDVVRELLEDKVLAATEGSLRHEVRVAVGALRTVERELRLGPGQLAAHRARLAALGVAGEAELADAIAAGRLDGRDDVVAAVIADVTDRLVVANPGWLAG